MLFVVMVLSITFVSFYKNDIINANKTVYTNTYTFTETVYSINIKRRIPYRFSFNYVCNKEILSVCCLKNSVFHFYQLNNERTKEIEKSFSKKPITFKDFYSINLDTIIVMANKHHLFYMINSKGEIYDTIDFSAIQEINKFAPAPLSGSCNPVVLYKHNLIFTGYLGGENKEDKVITKPVLVYYNLTEGKTTFKLDYPKIYKDYNWAGLSYRKVYNTYNPKTKSIIISYPASHKVYVYNITNGIYTSYYSGSKNIHNISPFSINKDWYGALAKQDYITFFYKNPSYSEIYYDKYKDLYYRLAEFPNNNFSYTKIETYKKQKSIIILDNEFKYIGEYQLPYDLFPQSIFINKNGINIIMPNKSIDSTMKIKLLTPVKISKK